MMRNRGTRRRKGYLEEFRLEDAYTVKPDRTAGRAGLLSGLASDGVPVLVKVWPRVVRQDDAELEEIWRHELRQLHRLAGYPGASEIIVHLRQAGFDDRGFYLVLDPGNRRPLQTALTHSSQNHWLRQPRLPANRVRIWRNLKRVSAALEILHAQGLLHRNIDAWAILTAATDEPDFQLTGFEWSMRLVAAEQSAKSKKGVIKATQDYSFEHDWLLLALLAADLLGIKPNRLRPYLL